MIFFLLKNPKKFSKMYVVRKVYFSQNMIIFIIDFSQLSMQSARTTKPPAMQMRKRKFSKK